MIKVLYFASLREQVGTGAEQLELPHGVSDLGGLTAHLRERGGVWASAFAPERTVMMAVNQEAARPEHGVNDGDEIAFYPPVTGG
jgi:molybdopterin synthase sulfur carrier subunit